MNVVVLALLGLLLLGHGAIHLWWLMPPNAEAARLTDARNAWPTRWGADAGLVRAASVALALAVATLYAASAFGILWAMSAPTWRAVTLAASLLSLVLLLAYWSREGWMGVAIDVGLVVLLLLDLPARAGIPRAA